MTHYVPAFVPKSRRGDQAVCGAYVRAESEFSTEPTCPGCKAWLDDASTTTAASFDVDRSVVGEPIEPQRFQSLAGYRRRDR